MATDEKVSLANCQTHPTIIPRVMWNWNFPPQRDSPLSKFLRRTSRRPFTGCTSTFGDMTYQITANFAGTLEEIGESKIFGLFQYIPSKFIRNVWGKVRKTLFPRTSPIVGTQLATDEKVSLAKFQTDPTIIPGVMWNWKCRAQKDSPLSKSLRRISRRAFTGWTSRFGDMTYQITANFAATLEEIGESKIFGLFPYIPS